MKKTFTFIFALLATANLAFGADVIGGVSYNLNPETKEAAVTSSNNQYFGDVVIPEQVTKDGVTYTVTSIEDDAFFGESNLHKIQIPGTVKTIGNSAFMSCTSLQEIIIPEGVTSIGPSAFMSCTYLKHATIANSVTSLGQRAFNMCKGLLDVKLSNGLTVIEGYTFDSCESLQEAIIPEGVTKIETHAFDYCNHITKIVLPSTLTNIEYAAFGGMYDDRLKDVYSFAETAPEGDMDAFTSSHLDKVVLHVPAGHVGDYDSKAPWLLFDNIVEMSEEDGIQDITAAVERGNGIYDLQGRRQNELKHGINIIGGKKIMVK